MTVIFYKECRDWPLDQKVDICLKLLAHSSSFSPFVQQLLVYSGSNKLVGIVGLGQLAMAVLGLVHAFVLTALVYAINARSGAQLNPAVTIAFLVSRKMRGKVAALTIACQVLGAVIGAAVVYSMFGSDMSASVVLPKEGNAIRALILETVIAFALVYVVLATTRSKDFKIAPLAGVAIGFTLGFSFMLAGPISGGAMNPARAFAPALIVWNFDYQWIYWVAPILGGIIAAGLYKGLHSDSDIPSRKVEQMK